MIATKAFPLCLKKVVWRLVVEPPFYMPFRLERKMSNAEKAMIATKMNGSSCTIEAAPGEAVTLPFLAAEPVVELATVVINAAPKTMISSASKMLPSSSWTLLKTVCQRGSWTEFVLRRLCAYRSLLACHLYCATAKLPASGESRA